MAKEKYSEKLLRGKKYEGYVAKYFREKGYDVKSNIFYDSDGNESYQSMYLEGKYVSFPDMTIEKNETSIVVKYLVEVKSMQRLNRDGKVCVSMVAERFEDYKTIQEHENIPVHVVFIFYADPFEKEEWHAQSLNSLDKTKTLVTDLYDDEDRHYVWSTKKLKQIK